MSASPDSRVRWRTDPHALLDAAVSGMGGERRAGQHELTSAVADALSNGHHLLAEAPTGSGKSLAYLVAAVASGLKVVVATSTIALQSQLTGKDLPALEAHGTVPFSFALLKGRANYVCLAKLRAAGAPDALFEQPVGAGFARQLERLRTFAQRSQTGDRSEFEHEASDATWKAVTSTSIECPGKADCDDGGECFAERARDRAQEASILVVNHALYCAHLAAEGRVLPEHDVVIIDEAHAFPDNATNAFAGDISGEALTRLSSMLARAGADAAAINKLSEAGRALGAAIEAREGTVRVGADKEIDSALLQAAERLAAVKAKLVTAGDDHAKLTARIATGRLDVLRRLAAPADDDVVWVERVGRSRRLRIAPVAAGEAIAHALLAWRPVIGVSATLGGEPRFPALARQMGLHADDEPGSWGEQDDDDGHWVSNAGRGYASIQTPSSFEWKDQGILFVAKDLPDPARARDAWSERSADLLCDLVNAAGGRALVLCTSHANVGRFAAVLRERTDHRVLVQGDRDSGRLTKEFVDDETSVLVGTRSFWAGIDAAGASCVLVVIDKIPFPVPDEPLHAARRARAQRQGLDAFAAVDIPVAALVLAQGTGRLIRTRDDRGVVAVLDPRLAVKPYRTQLLAAMPPLRRSISLAEACAFLEEVAPRSSIAKVDQDPEQLRTDLSTEEVLTIRNFHACPVCEAAVSDRCRDDGVTSAFLHEGRVRAATA
ncbi:MAG TPA: ATP-dependent DNA helicase [Acidimicrobiia bacterium]|nr:ATP-dependent DNA helicase [Acidimicrobiia bacterium]